MPPATATSHPPSARHQGGAATLLPSAPPVRAPRPSRQLSVLVVDRHLGVRLLATAIALLSDADCALMQRVRSQVRIVGIHGDPDAALDAARGKRPDIAVLTTHMPDREASLELCRRLREASPQTRVLMYVDRDVPEVVAHAVDAGALGVLSAHDDLATLLRAIEQTGAGRPFVSPRLGTAPPRLTPREREVLTLISHGHTTESAARSLGVGTETVKTHVGTASRKLGATHRAHAVAVALRENLID